MLTTDALTRFGRRVRLGLVGGGLDSVIGETHLLALRACGLADVVAGAMSIDPQVARESGARLLLPAERTYVDWRVMLDRERDRRDGIDAVVIATPPQTHTEIAEAFLAAGVHVLCEKPMCVSVAEARRLTAAAAASGALFGLTRCYTGYPMVREAREIVRSGRIGRVTLVEGQLAAGDLGVLREPDDPADRHWRFRASSIGKASVLGEVGSHAHNLAEFVTGQRVTHVSAHLSTIAARREVYDNAYLTVRFDGGAIGRLWSSFVAAGNEHGLELRVFGEDGAVHWRQEDPEYLWLLRPGSRRGASPAASWAPVPARRRPPGCAPGTRRGTCWRSRPSTATS